MRAQVGDEIEVDSMHPDEPPRRGEVLEVRGGPDEEHYLVRWQGGHESIFFPGSTAHTVHQRTSGSS